MAARRVAAMATAAHPAPSGSEARDKDQEEEGDTVGNGREEEGEEGRIPVKVPTPCRVTKQERDMHELTHTPFRAWCKYCVKGRGKMHRIQENQERKVKVRSREQPWTISICPEKMKMLGKTRC